MIHNPFDSTEDNKDTEGEPDYVKAFRQQIEMIYMKRWGFNKTKVKELMSGKEGTDGTFFTAEEAVKAGIIPVENVLKTSKNRESQEHNRGYYGQPPSQGHHNLYMWGAIVKWI